MLNRKKYEQIAYDEAKKSTCGERKVGAVIVHDASGEVLGQGHNNGDGSCTCITENRTHCAPNVIHAEIHALNNCQDAFYGYYQDDSTEFTMFVTQPPCNECLSFIKDVEEVHTITIKIVICEQFLKFDNDKLRFELTPPEWLEYDAKVLTYGAKKYKPDNWRNGEISRYIGAVERHWNAYRKGEWVDSETGLPHLAHLRTNIGFLLTIHEDSPCMSDILTKLSETINNGKSN